MLLASNRRPEGGGGGGGKTPPSNTNMSSAHILSVLQINFKMLFYICNRHAGVISIIKIKLFEKTLNSKNIQIFLFKNRIFYLLRNICVKNNLTCK